MLCYVMLSLVQTRRSRVQKLESYVLNFEVYGPQFGEYRNSDFVRQKWYVLNDGKETGMASYSSRL